MEVDILLEYLNNTDLVRHLYGSSIIHEFFTVEDSTDIYFNYIVNIFLLLHRYYYYI